MASIVRASESLANGGLSLLSHTTSVADDAFVEVAAQFACLSGFASLNLSKFGPNKPWPLTNLPADLAALSLDTGNVYLLDYTSDIKTGICTIAAKFVGASRNKVLKTDISYERRTLGWTWTLPTRASLELDGSYKVEYIRQSNTVDYQAQTKRIAFAVVSDRLEPDVKVSLRILSRIKKPRVIAGDFTIVGLETVTERKTEVASATVEQVGMVKRIVKTVSASLLPPGSEVQNDKIGLYE